MEENNSIMPEITNLSRKDFAIRLAVVTGISLALAPVSAYVGYKTLEFMQVGKRKKQKAKQNAVEEYNRAVRIYNAATVEFNQATEARMEGVPKLKELMEEVNQEAYDEIFKEIMRKEF